MNTRMKIVHILNSNKFSGAERVAIQIIQYFSQQGMDVWYVSPRGEIGERLKNEGVKYYPIDKTTPQNIKKMLKDLQPDIIHAHDYRTSIVCAFSTKLPVLSHLHNNSPWIKKYGIYSWIYAVSTMRYRKILLVSDSILREYVFSRFIKKKCRVIGNPIKIKEIVEKGKEPVMEEKYDIIFVGRLSPPKNPFLLLEVVRELKKSYPQIQACIIGDGELWEVLRKRCKEFGLQENVVWKGFMENPFPYITRSKIFLLPSSWEGYGLAAVEALALGKPVVCSGMGGLDAIVDDTCGKKCGFEVSAYTKEIERLIEDKVYYECKSKGALVRANESDNFGKYMHYLKSIYECMAKNKHLKRKEIGSRNI